MCGINGAMPVQQTTTPTQSTPPAKSDVLGASGGGATASGDLATTLANLVSALNALQQAFGGVSALGGGPAQKGADPVVQQYVPQAPTTKTTPPAAPIQQTATQSNGALTSQMPSNRLQHTTSKLDESGVQQYYLPDGKKLKHPFEKIAQTGNTQVSYAPTKSGQNPTRTISEAWVSWDGKQSYWTKYPNVVQELRDGRWVIQNHGESAGKSDGKGIVAF